MSLLSLKAALPSVDDLLAKAEMHARISNSSSMESRTATMHALDVSDIKVPARIDLTVEEEKEVAPSRKRKKPSRSSGSSVDEVQLRKEADVPETQPRKYTRTGDDDYVTTTVTPPRAHGRHRLSDPMEVDEQSEEKHMYNDDEEAVDEIHEVGDVKSDEDREQKYAEEGYAEHEISGRRRRAPPDERMQLAHACVEAAKEKKMRPTPEFPFDTAQLFSFWNLTGGAPLSGSTKQQKTAQLCQELVAQETAPSKSMLDLMWKLKKNKMTLLNWAPKSNDEITRMQQMFPSQYLKYMQRVYGQHPEFRRRFDEMTLVNRCSQSDSQSMKEAISELTPAQELLRHYFTPFSGLPGLLIAHSTGSGKTSSSIALATSSWIFQHAPGGLPYRVGFVTASYLKDDYMKEIFTTFSYMLYREIAKNDKDLLVEMRSKRTSEERRAFLANDETWIQPQTYQEFANLVLNQASTTTRVTKLTERQAVDQGVVNIPREDASMVDALYVIDEVHNFVWHPHYEQYMNRIDAMRRKYGARALRIVALTATPMARSPLTFFRILRLIGVQYRLTKYMSSEEAKRTKSQAFRTLFGKLPMSEPELAKWMTNGGVLHPQAVAVLTTAMRGLISYTDVSGDATRFAHIQEDVTFHVKLSNIQVRGLERCFTSKAMAEEKPKRDSKQALREAAGRNAGVGEKYIESANAALSTSTKRFKCSREMENFAVTNFSEYYADRDGFFDKANDKFRDSVVDALPRLSPKTDAMLNQIAELDSTVQVRTDSGRVKLMKHAIYTHDQHAAKMLWSLMCADTFVPVQVGGGAGMILEERRDRSMFKIAVISVGMQLYGHVMTKNDVETVLEVFNSKENAYGELIRFVIFDHTIAEGRDLFDVTFLHVFEPTETSAQIVDILLESKNQAFKPMQDLVQQSINERARDYMSKNYSPAESKLMAQYALETDIDGVFKQVVGRVIRNCGHSHLKYREEFGGWPIYVYRYQGALPEDNVPPAVSKHNVGADGMPLSVFETSFTVSKNALQYILLNIQLTNVMINSSIERVMYGPEFKRNIIMNTVVPPIKESACVGFECVQMT